MGSHPTSLPCLDKCVVDSQGVFLEYFLLSVLIYECIFNTWSHVYHTISYGLADSLYFSTIYMYTLLKYIYLLFLSLNSFVFSTERDEYYKRNRLVT